MTAFPPLSDPRPVLTTAPGGEWHWINGDPRGNWGDGGIIIADDDLHLLARMGSPPSGAIYNKKPRDGDFYSDWPALSMIQPEKAIPSIPGTISGGVVDTHWMIRNPETGLFTAFHVCKPGVRPDGFTGFILAIQRATSMNPTKLAASWTRYGNEVMVRPDPAAPWTDPFFVNEAAPFEYAGGIDETSGWIDPVAREVVLYFEAKSRAVKADPFGNLLRNRIGRATCPLDIFDTAPVFTWTPAPGPSSYVFSPSEAENYGYTEETAVPGTANLTLRAHFNRFPDGVVHGVYLGATPSKFGGVQNRSTAIFHIYSLDNGFTFQRTAAPLVTWETMGAQQLTIANKLNSPFTLIDEVANKLYLCFWYNDGGANQLGTKLYAMEASLTSPTPVPEPQGSPINYFRPGVAA